jgi:hypothetical protein
MCSLEGATRSQRTPAPDRAAQLESASAEMSAALHRHASATGRIDFAIRLRHSLVEVCATITSRGCKIRT